MNSNKFWAAVSKTLAAVTVMLIATLILTPGVGAGGKYKTLYKFAGGADGNSPQEGLIFDSAGNLYGTTMYGGGTGCGGQGCGTVFKLSPNGDGSWSESLLYAFLSDPDSGPAAALIFDNAGNLYGTTRGAQWGWGSVFKLAPNPDGTWTESMLWTPKVHDDGYELESGLTFDEAGNLYGTTMWGGGGPPYSGGVVFRLTPNPDNSWTYSKLYIFQGNPDGRLPFHDGVVFDKSGNLYGQTTYGGTLYPVDGGTVYKLVPNTDGSWREKVLYRFQEGTDGDNPASTLVFGPDGNLYGTTYRGGSNNCAEAGYYDGTGCGIVFRMTPKADGNWKMHIIHRFTPEDARNPWGSLTFDTAGNLYGTTLHGGDMTCGTETPPLGCGAVFEMEQRPNGSWKFKLLHVFHDRPGAHATGGLVLDSTGNLYGTTAGDGKKTFGSVFEITP